MIVLRVIELNSIFWSHFLSALYCFTPSLQGVKKEQKKEILLRGKPYLTINKVFKFPLVLLQFV